MLLGTYGNFWLEERGEPVGPQGFTVELPWRDNAVAQSCIPTGAYIALVHQSPNFGKTLWLQDVPERSEILVHVGNSVQDFDGCIGLGDDIGYWPKRETVAVWNSRDTLEELLEAVKPDQEVLVEINERSARWR